jgi:Flp pilus assembly protein TadB
VVRFGYLQRRGLTPLEVKICLSALIVTITLVVLVATDVVGSWALLVACAIAMAVSLMRYRAETEQKKRNADDKASK